VFSQVRQEAQAAGKIVKAREQFSKALLEPYSQYIERTGMSSVNISRELLNEIATLVAEKVTNFIMKKIPLKRLSEINVVVTVKDPEKLLFEIDVDVKTDLLIKQDVLDEIVREATDYGFKILDEVMSYLLNGGEQDIEKIRDIIRRAARKYLDTGAQER